MIPVASSSLCCWALSGPWSADSSAAAFSVEDWRRSGIFRPGLSRSLDHSSCWGSTDSLSGGVGQSRADHHPVGRQERWESGLPVGDRDDIALVTDKI